jgi:hypothetical protein
MPLFKKESAGEQMAAQVTSTHLVTHFSGGHSHRLNSANHKRQHCYI